jgi:hypothetical protein
VSEILHPQPPAHPHPHSPTPTHPPHPHHHLHPLSHPHPHPQEIIKDWKSPTTCAKDESIDDIVYNNDTLILTIINPALKSVRMELRSSKTLERLWLLLLDITWNQNKTFCSCSLSNNEYLMADYETQRLLHISKDGQIKATIAYSETPYRLCRFGSNILAISTDIGVNLYKM